MFTTWYQRAAVTERLSMKVIVSWFSKLDGKWISVQTELDKIDSGSRPSHPGAQTKIALVTDQLNAVGVYPEGSYTVIPKID